MLPVILEVPRTSGESVAKDWGKGCAMGIGNNEAVCLDPGLLLLPEGWLMPLPHGIRRVYSFSVPSQGLHKSKHPLAVGPGSICQTPHSSTCIYLLIPVRSFSIAHLLPPARAGGVRCCRRSGRPGPADGANTPVGMAGEGSGLPACVQGAWCDAGLACVAVKFLEALLQCCCHSQESRGRGSAELQLRGAVGKRFNQGRSCTEHGWAGNEAEQRHFAFKRL